MNPDYNGAVSPHRTGEPKYVEQKRGFDEAVLYQTRPPPQTRVRLDPDLIRVVLSSPTGEEFD